MSNGHRLTVVIDNNDPDSNVFASRLDDALSDEKQFDPNKFK